MSWSDYWSALGSRQRIGLATGAAVIAVATLGVAVWLLHDPHVPFDTQLGAERVNELAQQLERAKLDYRVDAQTQLVTVPRSQLGKARAAAGAQFGAPPSVGLELFKESDFSSTDFVQKINYQRALQGELTRTIQTIRGVRSARVHLILAEGGVFKRNATKASAAVSVTLLPERQLTRAQVSGIQRLVVASVPEIKPEDVVVLDESGSSLTRPVEDATQELSYAQLDLKRQADQYLESKLMRLLQELVPEGSVSLSIDTTLDYQQLRVTTEEPLPAHESNNGARAAGVIVKERQWQRAEAEGVVPTGGFAGEAGRTDWEYEYRVGHRLQQTLSSPGSIKRVSVAVALQGAPRELSSEQVERLVAHAVGIDSARGDAVAVVMLPLAAAEGGSANQRWSVPSAQPAEPTPAVVALSIMPTPGAALLLAAVLTCVVAALWWLRRRRRPLACVPDIASVDAMTAKVREWLSEGAGNGRT